MQNAKPLFLWENLLASSGASVSATSSDPDHPIDYISDWREYLTWKGGAAAAIDIILDCGCAKPVTSLCIYGHNLNTAGVAAATLYGSSNGTDWSSITAQTVASDDPILKVFEPVSYRYYKLSFSEGSDAPEIALLFIGDKLEFPAWLQDGFDPDEQEVAVEKARSEEGYLLGVVEKYHKRKISLNFDYLSESFMQNSFLPFWGTHPPLPFLFAWDYQNHAGDVCLVEMETKCSTPYHPVTRSLKIDLEGRA